MVRTKRPPSPDCRPTVTCGWYGTDGDLTAHSKGLAACIAEMDCSSPESGEQCYILAGRSQSRDLDAISRAEIAISRELDSQWTVWGRLPNLVGGRTDGRTDCLTQTLAPWGCEGSHSSRAVHTGRCEEGGLGLGQGAECERARARGKSRVGSKSGKTILHLDVTLGVGSDGSRSPEVRSDPGGHAGSEVYSSRGAYCSVTYSPLQAV